MYCFFVINDRAVKGKKSKRSKGEFTKPSIPQMSAPIPQMSAPIPQMSAPIPQMSALSNNQWISGEMPRNISEKNPEKMKNRGDPIQVNDTTNERDIRHTS